jgi:integrase
MESKKPRKRKPGQQRLRRPKGSGTVEAVRRQGKIVGYRARKQSVNGDLYGTTRDSYDEADADRLSLKIGEDPAWDPKSVPTLTQFAEHVLLTEIKPNKEEGTFARQETIWRNRVDVHPLGKKRLDKITEADVQKFLDAQRKIELKKRPEGELRYEVTEKPLAPSSLRTIGAFLSVVFGQAKDAGYTSINPARDLRYPKPKNEAGKKKSLAPQEAAGLAGNLLDFMSKLRSQGSRFEAMILTARDTGMRRGELCGLKWDRVRLAGKVPYILVDTAQVRTEGGVRDSGTKSRNVREVPISPETYDRIQLQPKSRTIKDAKGNARTVKMEYVFTTENGTPVRADNFTKTFRAFREEVGMPTLKLHNLRHTYISLMLRARVDLKTIQKNVGHATPRMIMEVYGETFDESQVESVGRFMEVLRAAEEENKKKAS